MSDFDKRSYEAALLAFLQNIEGLGQSKEVVAEHLRYPAHLRTTLASSEEGKRLWEHPSAKALVSELLKDNALSRWFSPNLGPSPELRLTELRAHIASLIAAWQEDPKSPEQAVQDWSDLLLNDLKNPAPACSRTRILYGVRATQRIDLSTDTVIEPASIDNLRSLLRNAGGTERDVLRIPGRPAVLVHTASSVSRDDFGAFAATTANGMAAVLAENARWDIWLSTGVLPRLGDAYVVELSTFSTTPDERWPASARETHQQAADARTAILDPNPIKEIAKRMASVRGEVPSISQESVAPLWVVNTFIHPAIDTPDALMTLLLCYAGCEGLILRKEDDDTRFGPRLAALVGVDVDERRRIRKVAMEWMKIRGHAAHGQRPPIESVAAYLERPLSDHESTGLWFQTDLLRQSGRWRASQLLRRAFLAALFCAVTIDGTDLQLGWSRDQLLEVLEEAIAGKPSAQRAIDDRVPHFVKHASF